MTESPSLDNDPQVRIRLKLICLLLGGIKLLDLKILKKYMRDKDLKVCNIFRCVPDKSVLLLLSIKSLFRICGVIGRDCFTGLFAFLLKPITTICTA